jgi:hypothetical protein
LRRFEKGHCSRAFHQLCRHLKTGQLMVIFGYFWLFLVIFGYFWLFLHIGN